jgi:hypothetical protein
MIFDVAIVGAGPAGLFAAYELTKNPKNKCNVLIIEQGKDIDDRKPTDVMSGVGGSGTFSDGKLHFTPVLSHEKILDVVDRKDYIKNLDYVDKLFTQFGVDAPYTPENISEAEELVKFCRTQGINLYIRKCRHIGSDKTPAIIANMVEVLKKNGVKFSCNTQVKEILAKDNQVIGLKTDKKIYKAKKYLIAPGRIGARWFQVQAKKLSLDYSYQKVEIGVRVEFTADLMAEHSRIMHENIYSLQAPTFDDTVRTFCPCPNGKVALEKYDDYISVNGYSNSHSNSANSNFNLTTEVQFTDPIENTTDFAILIAKTASLLGGQKPIIQRLADLRAGRRSTWERIRRSFVIPTLTDVTPGDISLALPYRTVTNLLEGLEILDRVLPGLNSGSTLLYAPEMKLRGNRLKINKKMQTQISNLFVAGDGPGLAGNIVGAAVSGIFAARGIIATRK